MITRIPAEWEPHACCWMAWAVHREWGKVVSKVKRELSESCRQLRDMNQFVCWRRAVRPCVKRGENLRLAERSL
jgi:agmatine/peptidylarginine deiminase